jgi:membrane fusion protein (multidrug efflux system)
MEQKMQKVKNKEILDSLPTIIGVILLLIAGFFFFTGYEISKDAIVEGRMISVLSRVKGEVINVYIEDGQEVKKGDLLLEINPNIYQARLRAAEVELNNAKIKLAICEKPEREEPIVISDEKKQKSLIDSKYIFDRSDLEKFAKMFSGNVQKVRYKPHKDEETSKVESLNNQSKLPVLEEDTEEGELVDLEELRAKIKKLEANVADCKLELAYTKVYATQDGIISSRNVQQGDFVEVGQEIVNIIPKNVWIIANYKKAQTDYIHEGQFVIIQIEDFPRRFFKGMVDSVDEDVFEKSDNQKEDIVPVKIVLTKDYSEFNIVPGMSVKTSIKIK